MRVPLPPPSMATEAFALFLQGGEVICCAVDSPVMALSLLAEY